MSRKSVCKGRQIQDPPFIGSHFRNETLKMSLSAFSPVRKRLDKVTNGVDDHTTIRTTDSAKRKKLTDEEEQDAADWDSMLVKPDPDIAVHKNGLDRNGYDDDEEEEEEEEEEGKEEEDPILTSAELTPIKKLKISSLSRGGGRGRGRARARGRGRGRGGRGRGRGAGRKSASTPLPLIKV